MTALDERIAQFENMATADPENAMAHFSLGSAYLEAGRAEEAVGSFERCIKLNPEMSKAYQLAGESMIRAGGQDKAVGILQTGYEIAARKGERLPQNAIADILRSIDREPPQLSGEAQASAESAGAGAFVCQRTGRPGTQMSEPPMRGPVGEWVREHISEETWREWIGQGTKVINELHLDFSRTEDQDVYEQYMCEHLGLDEARRKELTQAATA